MAAPIHKGYLSFVIAFFGVLIVGVAHQMAVSTQEFDYSESIAILKAHSLEMNVREVVKELARFGVKQADKEILATDTLRALKEPPEPPLSSTEKEAIYKRHVLLQLQKLDSYSFSDEFEVDVGCGPNQAPFSSFECQTLINIYFFNHLNTGKTLAEVGEMWFENPELTYVIRANNKVVIEGRIVKELNILTDEIR